MGPPGRRAGHDRPARDRQQRLPRRAALRTHGRGDPLTWRGAAEGFSGEIAARVTSATGTWRIKGLRTDYPRAWTQHREAVVAPFLCGPRSGTRGAAWLDAGHWVIWLVAAGHAPASAERWAAGIPSWCAAPAEGVTAFAAASANVWSEIGNADPGPWTLRLATAATAWHAHRRTD
ncbi:hypothetical protein ACFZDF_05605 [Streptomyces sp. NPDC007910]|uniref:hypothetical protein n=1 Tax=Streptomyces sp. NPDC007910 TaxID=3364790 RepID=UPI0036E40FAA